MFQVILEQNFSSLKAACITAQKNAYSIHSNFRVGSAVLSSNGKIYTGSSVDCSIYGLSMCAERSALLKAISNREICIVAIIICSDILDGDILPCGGCREFMTEFRPSPEIFILRNDNSFNCFKIDELIPYIKH